MRRNEGENVSKTKKNKIMNHQASLLPRGLLPKGNVGDPPKYIHSIIYN